MRLIDADSLIARVKTFVYPQDLTTTLAVDMAMRWIETEPTVEHEVVQHIESDMQADELFHRVVRNEEMVRQMSNRLLNEDAVVDWILERTEMYDEMGHFVGKESVRKRIEEIVAEIPSAQRINMDSLSTFLDCDSPYVFYDSDHGFCINTQDVFDYIRERLLDGADIEEMVRKHG